MKWTDQARRQAGVISNAQLISLGLSAASVNGMLYRGRLEKSSSAGVYRVVGAPATGLAACWVAALASKSPLSYLTAAELWEVPAPDDGHVHITRFDRRRLDWPPGVRVHRVVLDRAAVTTRHGLLVTTRTETLLDCIGWLELGEARTLADRAQQQKWLSPADIERRLTDQPYRWGNKRLRSLLPSLGDGAHSEAERRLHQLLRLAGITGWRANFAVQISGGRYVVDVAFPALMLAIEIDGYRTHSRRDVFQSDRTKGNALTAAGWTLLRFTWSDLVDRPDRVIATMASLLAA